MMVTMEKELNQTGKVLPEGWKWVKLGDICDFIGGMQPPKSTFSNRLLPGYIRLVQIQDFRRSDMAVYIPEEEAKRRFDESDVMIGRYGPPVFQILRGLSGAYNVALMKTAPKPCITKDYLYYLLQESSIQKAVISQSQRSAGQSGVQRQFLEQLTVPLPPLAEQKRIVAILNEKMAAIEKARTATLAQIEAAKALPAAYLRQVFDSPEAQTWERKKLGELMHFKNGINFTSEQKGIGILTIDVMNMYSDSHYIDLSKLYRVNTSISAEYMLNPDDILFVRSSVKREGVAWSAIYPGHTETVTFCGFLIRARMINQDIYPEYLINYLRSSAVREILISKSGTGTITNINQANLSTLQIPLPLIEQQKKISDKLTQRMNSIKEDV